MKFRDDQDLKSKVQKIREPLCVIGFSAYLLKNTIASKTGKTARHVAIIESQIKRACAIIDEIIGNLA